MFGLSELAQQILHALRSQGGAELGAAWWGKAFAPAKEYQVHSVRLFLESMGRIETTTVGQPTVRVVSDLDWQLVLCDLAGDRGALDLKAFVVGQLAEYVEREELLGTKRAEEIVGLGIRRGILAEAGDSLYLSPQVAIFRNALANSPYAYVLSVQEGVRFAEAKLVKALLDKL